MTRYSVVLFATAALILLTAFVIATAGVRLGHYDPEGDDLVRERAEQLGGPPAEIVFVGDSSVGFAVEADHASALLGRTTANLALSGSFGVAGSLEMIRRAEAAFGTKIFVIVHTVDILGRPTPALVAARAKPPEGRSLLETARMGLSVMSLRDLRDIVRNVAVDARAVAAANAAEEFYDHQSKPAPIDALVRDLPSSRMASVDPGAVADLLRIADHCAARGLTCLYAHGPFWEVGCARFAAAIAQRSALIRSVENAHFRLLAETPFCMPTAIVGNNSDHVRPGDDAVTTRFYAGLVDQALKDGSLGAPAR
ncbi:MAG: hypothetical protein ACK4QW_15355 [Alphaproteobacteria bacterium]